jgi:hypothetical protein
MKPRILIAALGLALCVVLIASAQQNVTTVGSPDCIAGHN